MSINLATKITIARILAVPFLIATVLYSTPQRAFLRHYALGLFLIAVVSDFFDGYIARTRNQKSPAGAILDPLADKLLLISAFICLYKVGVYFEVVRFPFWFIVAVISRDAILLLGIMIIYMMHHPIDIKPSVWGRLTIFFEVIAILAIFIQLSFSPVIWYITLFFVIISLMDYIVKGIRIINKKI